MLLQAAPAGALGSEAGDEKEVAGHVGQLPLVEASAVTVEIMPLAPYTGAALLFALLAA